MAEIGRTTRKLKWWPSNDKDGDQSVCISRSLMERWSGLEVWSGLVKWMCTDPKERSHIQHLLLLSLCSPNCCSFCPGNNFVSGQVDTLSLQSWLSSSRGSASPSPPYPLDGCRCHILALPNLFGTEFARNRRWCLCPMTLFTTSKNY